jgi:retinol dehydrogenase-12
MDFIRAQCTKIPAVAPTNLSRRTVLITGATSGLGLETAREILKSNPARLILAVRSMERGNAAVSQLKDGNVTSTEFELRHLDQANFASIKAFTDGLANDRLDIAILSAGVWNFGYKATSDGYESDLQVNVLAPALLSLLLLPNLRRQAAAEPSSSPFTPRLTFVSSALHAQAKFPERNLPAGQVVAALNDPSKYDGFDRYSTTKLLGLFWAKQLAAVQDAREERVTINAVNPGFCKTGILGNAQGAMKYVMKLSTAMLGRSPEDGARCIVDAAMVKGHDSHGRYLSEAKIAEEAPVLCGAEGKDLQRRIWEEVLMVLKKESVISDEQMKG